ncbi:MAG TPA: hypothetical protein PKK82_06820, partial [Anaerolineaceae bacterium]|nr:hypothetical protein [Anaerolineaceae bacterium]
LVHSNPGFDRNKRLEDAENLAEKICIAKRLVMRGWSGSWRRLASADWWLARWNPTRSKL